MIDAGQIRSSDDDLICNPNNSRDAPERSTATLSDRKCVHKIVDNKECDGQKECKVHGAKSVSQSVKLNQQQRWMKSKKGKSRLFFLLRLPGLLLCRLFVSATKARRWANYLLGCLVAISDAPWSSSPQSTVVYSQCLTRVNGSQTQP